MQIIFLILFLFFIPGLLSGDSGNLLKEWEKGVPANGTPLLPQWRFGDWGVGKTSRKGRLRSHKVELKEGRLTVTLENKIHAHSANMLFRPYLLRGKGKNLYKFSLKAVNTTPDKALLRIRVSSSGGKYVSREKIFSVSSSEESFSVELEVPEKNKTLSIQICLSGPGRVVLSQAHLSAEAIPPAAPSLKCTLPGGTFLLPERNPVLFPVKLPIGRRTFGESFVSVTLPWGIRLINTSVPVTGESIKLKPGEYTVTRLKLPAKRTVPDGRLYLLLGSDLPASEKIYTGSLVYEDSHGKSEQHFFPLQVVKELSVLPPRTFQIMLNGSEKVAALESKEAADNALLRSGANILNAPLLTIPGRTLKNAHIKQYCDFFLPPAPEKQNCYYAMIRDESFWEKHFIPHLRRRIIRQQSSPVQALLCDFSLGQRRGIECLCVLCRAELADFAPQLPPQAVVNYSTALLNSRFSKELRKFRHARLTTLFEAAKYHLPTGKSAFTRRPRLIPCYAASHILSMNTPLVSSSEAVVDFHRGALLPDGLFYNGAVNFVIYEAVRKKMAHLLPKRKVMAKLSPAPPYLPPEKLKFEILNLLFSNYSGVWISLPPGADWQYNTALAETADLIREYEHFFLRKKTEKSSWHLTQEKSCLLLLPPIPGAGLYRQESASGFPGLQLRVWQHGKETLIAIGNFSDTPRSCTLANKALPGNSDVTAGQQKFSGKELAEKGIELTIPPYSWKFLKSGAF